MKKSRKPKPNKRPVIKASVYFPDEFLARQAALNARRAAQKAGKSNMARYLGAMALLWFVLLGTIFVVVATS